MNNNLYNMIYIPRLFLPVAHHHNKASTNTPKMTDTPNPHPTTTSPRRKPIPGKGFRKSRRGCFACKRRRVKCSETRPGCHGCRRMGLDCVYPERAAVVLSDARPQAVSAAPAVNVCLDHLRFFRHFLVEAYPPHPYGAEGVWQDVAALSHEVRR